MHRRRLRTQAREGLRVGDAPQCRALAFVARTWTFSFGQPRSSSSRSISVMSALPSPDLCAAGSIAR